jgi:hypothetical protein
MPLSHRRFERSLEIALREYLLRRDIREHIVRSWYPFKGQQAAFYTPITDIAVGPFAVRDRLIPQYDGLEERNIELSSDLESCFRASLRSYTDRFPAMLPYSAVRFAGNYNARCFIAVEIESKKTSKKHKMGSIVNAAALGRIGIVVGLDDAAVWALIRVLGYLKFLASVDKPTFKADNIFIISAAQILRVLEGRNR